MTITNTDRAVVYTGNGVTTVFPYAFPIPDAESLHVELVEIATGVVTVVDAADYTATGLGNSAGGTITYPNAGAALAATHRITIYREIPVTQEVVITNQTAYYADVAMGVWDRHVMIMQELRDDSNRSVKVPVGSVGTPAELTQQLSLDITNVSQNIADINSVADGLANIDTVVTNIADVQTVADNIAAVQAASGSVVSMAAASFTGDGTTAIFPLPATTAAVENVLVWLDGVHINPTEDYTATSAAITLAAAPGVGVEVRVLVITALTLGDVTAARDAALVAAAAAEAAVASINAADIVYKTDNLTGLSSVPTALTNLGISTFFQSLLNDADAAGVLTSLGVSAFVQTLLDDLNAAAVRTSIGAQAALGFTPIQQGGGNAQGANKVYIGLSTTSQGLRATVDSTDMAYLARANTSQTVMGEIAAQTGTATGTYILAYYAGAIAMDTLVAGSALRIASVEDHDAAAALPGTWRLMGKLASAGTALFMRVA